LAVRGDDAESEHAAAGLEQIALLALIVSETVLLLSRFH
jgi:hypothetical protein